MKGINVKTVVATVVVMVVLANLPQTKDYVTGNTGWF